MDSVAVLGGTFDPPHAGHIAMARIVLKRLPVRKVLFMPAPRPPHKAPEELTPYEVRKAMLEAALQEEDGMELSGLEEHREGPSYTVDLLRRMRRATGEKLFLILGADTVADLPNWKEPQVVLELATIVVFRRAGYSSVIPVGETASVVLLEEPIIDVSSTRIREAYRRGRAEAEWVPPAVHKFILDNSLYS